MDKKKVVVPPQMKAWICQRLNKAKLGYTTKIVGDSRRPRFSPSCWIRDCKRVLQGRPLDDTLDRVDDLIDEKLEHVMTRKIRENKATSYHPREIYDASRSHGENSTCKTYSPGEILSCIDRNCIIKEEIIGIAKYIYEHADYWPSPHYESSYPFPDKERQLDHINDILLNKKADKKMRHALAHYYLNVSPDLYSQGLFNRVYFHKWLHEISIALHK
jgi:hypothetical protein